MVWLPEPDEVKDPVKGEDLLEDDSEDTEEQTEDTSGEELEEEEDNEEEQSSNYNELKAQLDQTQAMLRQLMANTAKTPVEEPDAELEIPEFNFVEGVDMDELMTNPKLLNVMLNQAARHGAKVAYIESLKQAPNKVAPVVQRKVSEAQKVESFFLQNKDIARFRPYFNTMIGEIYNANPSMNLDALLNATAKKVRQDLNIAKPVGRKKKTTGSVAPKGGGGFQKKKKDSELSDSQKALEYIRKKRGEIRFPQQQKG